MSVCFGREFSKLHRVCTPSPSLFLPQERAGGRGRISEQPKIYVTKMNDTQNQEVRQHLPAQIDYFYKYVVSRTVCI